MIIFLQILFWASVFIVFWAMLGYSMTIRAMGKVMKNRINLKNYQLQPTVTLLIVAHNEEVVIERKLNNSLKLNYPRELIHIIVSSDNSTDATNDIVRNFIKKHPDWDIELYEVKERKGKTNAQDEALKLVKTEYLVMTDANSILDKNSIKELMSSFVSDDIAYVSGALKITNKQLTDVSNLENSYWDSDLKVREVESRIKTITAGNGALYACRTRDYVNVELIESHDNAMPLHYALNHKRAIANHEAIAYEKAGENIGDEFKRKVRMNRTLIKRILPDIRLLNIFNYGWFSFFYFGHRTCRYLLWISHLVVLVTSFILGMNNIFYEVIFWGQIMFYLLAIIKPITKVDNKILNLIYYYTVTVMAQWVGVFNILTGRATPFWEKAESTR